MHSNSSLFACGAFPINFTPSDFCILITRTCIFVTSLLACRFVFYIFSRHFMSVCRKQNVSAVVLIYSKEIMRALIFCTCHPLCAYVVRFEEACTCRKCQCHQWSPEVAFYMPFSSFAHACVCVCA